MSRMEIVTGYDEFLFILGGRVWPLVRPWPLRSATGNQLKTMSLKFMNFIRMANNVRHYSRGAF